MEVGTISNELERKYLCQDLLKEKSDDEDGGIKTRVEFDSDFSESEEEENAHLIPEDPNMKPPDPENDWGKILNKHRDTGSTANTGPKGVKADYNEAKGIVRRRNETKKLQKIELMKGLSQGIAMKGESVSYASMMERQKQEKDNTTGNRVQDHEDSDESDDDEFLAAYRMKRMAEMLKISSLPQYGRVKNVGRFEFLDEVDNADPRTYVVVHLYEKYIVACKRMNDILDTLAQRHTHVKFCRLIATEADQSLSHRGLPAFLVYKNKEMISDVSVEMAKTEFQNEKFTEHDVEWLLASKYHIKLQGVDISEGELVAAP